MAKRKTAAKPQLTITSLELMALETSRASLSLLRKQLKESDDRVKALEADIIGRLEAGARIQGNAFAEVKEESGQCRPEWKEHYLGHMVASHHISAEVAGKRSPRGHEGIPIKKTLFVVVMGA